MSELNENDAGVTLRDEALYVVVVVYEGVVVEGHEGPEVLPFGKSGCKLKILVAFGV